MLDDFHHMANYFRLILIFLPLTAVTVLTAVLYGRRLPWIAAELRTGNPFIVMRTTGRASGD